MDSEAENKHRRRILSRSCFSCLSLH